MISEQLFQKLAEWRPGGEGRQTLDLPLAELGWTGTLTADRVESLGCQVWEIELNRPTPASFDLKASAEAILSRVSGLMEDLQLVELDTLQQVALLRSETPSKKQDNLLYYELIVKPESIRVQRFCKSTMVEGKREQVVFTLTNEVIAKFISDLLN